MPNNSTTREMLHESADKLRHEVDHDVLVHPDRNVIVVSTGHVSHKMATFMAREGLEASPRIEQTMCCDQHGTTAHVREMALSLAE